MNNSKNKNQFESFVEQTVTPKEGDGTESGFFGTNSLESQKILGQTLKKQRKIKLSKAVTIMWVIIVIMLIISVASVFIFKL